MGHKLPDREDVWVINHVLFNTQLLIIHQTLPQIGTRDLKFRRSCPATSRNLQSPWRLTGRITSERRRGQDGVEAEIKEQLNLRTVLLSGVLNSTRFLERREKMGFWSKGEAQAGHRETEGARMWPSPAAQLS